MFALDLAWAAGFFDAEGCFSASSRPPVATMSQVGLECLDTFDAILDGVGSLRGPYEKSTATMRRKPQWIYTAYGRDARAIFDALKPWLGSYRLDQAQECFGPLPSAAPTPFEAHPWTEQVAWAGGFFDGEGCFAWITETMTARITHTDKELLDRFHAAMGFGKIYGPYEPHKTSFGRKPHYVYSVTGFERVQAVLAILWSNLSSAKRSKAIAILEHHRTYWRCGHRRGPIWKRHCPICFKPGPKPGSRRAKPTDARLPGM